MSREQYKDFKAAPFLEELYGGVFAEQMARAIKEVVAGVDDHKRQGKIAMTLKIKPFEGGEGVMIEHSLQRDMPEAHGNSVRKIINKTHMYVGTNGAASVLPEKQTDLFETMADDELKSSNISKINTEKK